MGISTLVTIAADAVSLGWSAASYLPWYLLSGQSHKALMNGRKKSIGIQGEHVRRAEEHEELITHFKGLFDNQQQKLFWFERVRDNCRGTYRHQPRASDATSAWNA